MPDDWGGIERYVAYLSTGLANKGHSVEIACPRGSPLERQSTVPTLEIRLNSKYDLRALSNYLRYFRSKSFDIVNVHFSPDYFVPAFAAKLCRQDNVLLTRHLAIGWRPSRVKLYSRLYKHIIGVSEAVRHELVVKSGFAADFVSSALAGVPALEPKLSSSRAREKFGMTDGFFHVGSFGRLTKEKGHAELIEIGRGVSGMKIHIFGSGPEQERLESRASSTTCKLHGRVESVADAMNAVDLVAMPSLWEEAFGLAVIEAYSLSKPVIASPRGGLPEIVQDGVTGYLIDPERSKQTFIERLSGLANNSTLCESLGRQAQSLYQEQFTVAHFASRIESIYRTAASIG